MLEQIYIARHGYRMNWLPPPHPPNPTGIDSDPPLAPHGVEQARQLAGYLTSLPKQDQPQFILSSPFYRCVETAQPISEMLDLQIVLERGVGEWYKVGRGVIPEPADYDRLKTFFSKLADENLWNRDATVGVIPSLSGETEEQIFDRCQTFWAKFFPVFEQKFPHIKSILIITHAATKIGLGMSLLKRAGVRDYVDDDNTLLRAGACSLDKYVLENGQWAIKMNGNCEFLTNGEEMNWDFHYGFEAGSDEDIKARKKKAASADTATKPVTEVADATDSDKQDFEEFYVTVDIPMIGEAGTGEVLKPSTKLQISDISQDNPLIKLFDNSLVDNDNDLINNISLINEKLYQLKWEKLVGNDLIFDEYGEYIGKVNQHLQWDGTRKFVEKKEHEEKIKAETSDDKTNFYRKMMHLLETHGGDDRPN